MYQVTIKKSIKMENKKEKIRIGQGKKQSETWLKSSLCLTDIPADKTFEYNGKMYVKVNINIFETPNKFGKDVSISIDEFEPKKTEQKTETDLPF